MERPFIALTESQEAGFIQRVGVDCDLHVMRSATPRQVSMADGVVPSLRAA